MDIPSITPAQALLSSHTTGARESETGDAAGETFHQALSSASSEQNKVSGAAKQFEALIASQVLKSIRDANQGGWLGNNDDDTGELTLEMGEQAFAQALADRGAFGIAKIVTDGLARGHSKTANSAPDLSALPAPESKLSAGS